MENIYQWYRRIQIFFRERYFPGPYIMAALLNTIAIFSILQLKIQLETPQTTSLLLIAFNTFAFPLVMRICDEYKDLDSDLVHFPERCIPRGAVKIQDVTLLGLIFTFLFILFNFLFLYSNSKSFIPAIGLLVYLYFFLKYFFFPKQVSGHLILAFIVSNPITYCLSLYNLYILIPQFSFSLNIILVSLLFWIPSWIWEIARKIRIASEETGYQTYSRYLGIPLSCLIPASGVILMAIILGTLAQGHLYFNFYQNTLAVISFIYLSYMSWFIFKPTKFQSQQIQKVTEIVLMGFLFAEISFIALKLY